MKSTFNAKNILQVVILSALLMMIFTFNANSQDKKQGSAKEAKITVKIDNGDTSKGMVIDTTFNLSDPNGQKEFEKYVMRIDSKADMPCHEGEMMPFGRCEKFISFNDEDGSGMQRIQSGEREETLGDIIGDIPMSRVKSYKIKDKKNGKRIIIDVEDPPLMERQDNRKVVIIRKED